MLEASTQQPDRNSAGTLRVGLVGLGCAKNTVDAELMLGHLRQAGLTITAAPTEADVVVVNTCGFVVDAKRESIEAILEVVEAKRRGTVRRLVVAGCMAQRYAAELVAEIPEIDAFIGLDELEMVVDAVRGELAQGRLPDQRAALKLYDSRQPRLVSTRSFAYLKIADGCDNPCSFCHIPRMRGRFRSRTPHDLVAEASRLAEGGVKELVLVAQDTTRYGADLGLDGGLLHLLARLLEETDLPWIRVLYAYPATLDERLFELMAASPRLLPYLDLPLQHASRRVLQAMRRGGDPDRFVRLIERARARVPSLTVRSTFIVGFPGEEESDVDELLDFVHNVRFDHVGVFCYSFQEENPAAALGDPIPEAVKRERRATVMEQQQGISAEHNAALVGKRLPALVEGRLPEMELLTSARLARHAPEVDGNVLVNDGAAPPGALVEVEITESHAYDLVGRAVRILQV